MWGSLIFSCCVHKFDFYHKKGIVILSYCAHKYDLRHNLCILIFVFCVHTCFVVLTFCRCPNILGNTLLIVFRASCLFCIVCTVFSPFSWAIKPSKKYHWSLLKIKWIIQFSLMKKIFKWFIRTKIMTITKRLIQAGWMTRHLS